MGERAGDFRLKLLGAVLAVLGATFLALGLMLVVLAAGDPGGKALYYIGPIFGFLSVLYFVPSLVAGWGLLAGKRWSVVLAGVLSALLLLAIPVGTALGAFGLWAVFTGKAPPAPATPAPRPTLPPVEASAESRRVLGVLAMAGLVGCGFIVFLGVGFTVSGDAAPPGLIGLTLPAAIVFAALSAFMWIRRPFAEFPDVPRENPIEVLARGRRVRRQNKASMAAYGARLARLDADPVRRTYAARMRMGEWWSDEEIEYDLDRARLVTCAHLRPLERAMRDAGLTVKPKADSMVACDCRVEEARLVERFAPPPFVAYREFFLGGRAATDFPVAQIRCEQDSSVVEVVHPTESRPATPWFPAPPP